MIIQAKIIGSGSMDDPYRVNLPTYKSIREITKRNADGTFPIDAIIEIDVPDDECDSLTGTIDKEKIRAKYAGQRWDSPTVGDGI